MMTMWTRSLLLVLALGIAGCASKRVHVLDNSEYGETITLDVGETLEINVYSNPASGMEWKREGEGSPVLVELDSRFESLHPEAGDTSGGVLTLRLRAEQPGQEMLRYVYRPALQSDALPADRVDVVVKVE